MRHQKRCPENGLEGDFSCQFQKLMELRQWKVSLFLKPEFLAWRGQGAVSPANFIGVIVITLNKKWYKVVKFTKKKNFKSIASRPWGQTLDLVCLTPKKSWYRTFGPSLEDSRMPKETTAQEKNPSHMCTEKTPVILRGPILQPQKVVSPHQKKLQRQRHWLHYIAPTWRVGGLSRRVARCFTVFIEM